MRTALCNARLLIDEQLVDGKTLLIEAEHIVAIVDADDQRARDAQQQDLDGLTVLPGFIDIQVNGGGGLLFNDAPCVETIRHIGRTHRRFGTTGFLPTLISDDFSTIERAIAAVDSAIDQGVPGVLGIHLEGPFLSTDRKGIHNPQKFRQLEARHVDLLSSLKRGKTLITLAPENAPPELIRTLTAKGVIASAGHTNASYTITRRALDHGVTGFTHLFNAMSPLIAREPGATGAALEDQASWCGIIVDGRHVSPVALKLALRCKPLDKFMLVTDAMPTVGALDQPFVLQGRKIVVDNGVCVTDNGTIAGSNLDMCSATRQAMTLLDLPLHQASNMASINPATFLGLDQQMGRIAPGLRANLVALNRQLKVVESWIDGQANHLAEPELEPQRNPHSRAATKPEA